MSKLQLDDIQGIIPYGYGRLRFAAFLLLEITEVKIAKQWLSHLTIRNAEAKPSADDRCINLAFTYAGLQRLGLSETLLNQFTGEFREGMAGSEHRRRILGDIGLNDSRQWRWGGPDNSEIHALLMLYAGSQDALEQTRKKYIADQAATGLRIITELDTNALPGHKEHFGFHDGMGQPAIAGIKDDDVSANTIAAGEFILGYVNAYGQYTDRPQVDKTQDPDGLLPNSPDNPEHYDLGLNGSYLVFRQLSQNVHEFWNHLANQTRDRNDQVNPSACVALASKMVGRWPSGAPLVKTPDVDNPDLGRNNDFLYYGSDDPHGYKCPIGAHIRRTNPRDALDPQPGSERSIEVGKRHRIMRRGRTYGSPLSTNLDPAEMIASDPDETERGLHFLCFNTHIGRQFEFIQHTWVNNPKFDGLYADDDPIIGPRTNPDASGVFTMQNEPARKRVSGLPQFVHVRGGAYFFMPGIRAVRYLASLPG